MSTVDKIMALADAMAARNAERDIPTWGLYRGIAHDRWVDARQELRAAVTELAAENETLRAERDALTLVLENMRSKLSDYEAAMAENEALRAAVEAERERCARLCAEMGAATWWPNEERDMADLLRKMILDGSEHAKEQKR